MIILII